MGLGSRNMFRKKSIRKKIVSPENQIINEFKLHSTNKFNKTREFFDSRTDMRKAQELGYKLFFLLGKASKINKPKNSFLLFKWTCEAFRRRGECFWADPRITVRFKQLFKKSLKMNKTRTIALVESLLKRPDLHPAVGEVSFWFKKFIEEELIPLTNKSK
ncbi:MAG: hypothetical protein JW703_04790 [Candidatus Diapherotrites archaeon]|nr:hypothetical protein [Candidatus Diapherotrites archaeon]